MKIFKTRPYLPFILPAFTIMVVLITVPIVVMVWYSLTDYEIGRATYEFVWFENYERMLSSAAFWHSTRLTLVYALLVTTLSLSIGFLIALLVDRHVKLRPLAIALLVVPIAMTPSIAGQIWSLILNSEYGVLNFLLDGAFSIRQPWLAADWAFASVVLVSVWHSAPFASLIMFAGLQSMPTEPFEAAKVDGARAHQSFWHITLPLMRMPILLAMIFVSIDALRIFDTPFTLTQGGPGDATELLGMYIYRLGFGQTGWVGRASAGSFMLMLLTLAIALVLIYVFRRSSRGVRS